jgi:hypothetical protein
MKADSPLAAIEKGVFRSTPITAFVLPAKVRAIKSQGFANCNNRFVLSISADSNLEEIQAIITIPPDLCTIGDNAFKNCRRLEVAAFDCAHDLVGIGARHSPDVHSRGCRSWQDPS